MEVIESSWRDFRERLLRYAALPRSIRESYIFRGHGDSTWPLQSTLDRQFPGLSAEDLGNTLQRLLYGFASELYGIETRNVVEDSEGLELLGRHHGLPTTVLDWSRSPYVAAYFAFEGSRPPASGYVAVWTFDRRQLNQAAVASDVLIDDMALLGDNARALQQRGVFLRLPPGVNAEEALSPGLRKFTIPYSERRLVLCDLDEMLITARSLFRDKDAAARTALIRELLE